MIHGGLCLNSAKSKECAKECAHRSSPYWVGAGERLVDFVTLGSRT